MPFWHRIGGHVRSVCKNIMRKLGECPTMIARTSSVPSMRQRYAWEERREYDESWEAQREYGTDAAKGSLLQNNQEFKAKKSLTRQHERRESKGHEQSTDWRPQLTEGWHRHSCHLCHLYRRTDHRSWCAEVWLEGHLPRIRIWSGKRRMLRHLVSAPCPPKQTWLRQQPKMEGNGDSLNGFFENGTWNSSNEECRLDLENGRHIRVLVKGFGCKCSYYVYYSQKFHRSDRLKFLRWLVFKWDFYTWSMSDCISWKGKKDSALCMI